MRPFELDKIAKRSRTLQPAANLLLKHPRRALAAVSIADTVVNVPLLLVGYFLLSEWEIQSAFVIDVLLLFALVILPCDLLPKLFAHGQAHRLGRPALTVLTGIMHAFGPLCEWLEKQEAKLPASATAPIRLDTQPSEIREDEFATFIDLKAEEGVLHVSEGIVLQEIIRLGDKRARDIMTPRVDMFSLPDELSNETAIRLLRAKRFRRVPVCAPSVDDIVGVLDVKDFLMDPSRHYTEMLAAPSFVPETLNALDLLRGLLKEPRRMAVVLDEFGGTEGIVTLSDAVEEILGDALPEQEDPLYVEELGDGILLVSGKAPAKRVEEYYGVEHLCRPGVRTVHQLLEDWCGYIPRTNAVLTFAGLEFQVRGANRRRVREVLIRREPKG